MTNSNEFYLSVKTSFKAYQRFEDKNEGVLEFSPIRPDSSFFPVGLCCHNVTFLPLVLKQPGPRDAETHNTFFLALICAPVSVEAISLRQRAILHDLQQRKPWEVMTQTGVTLYFCSLEGKGGEKLISEGILHFTSCSLLM